MTVEDCRKELQRKATQVNIRLIWVPGHSQIEGNEKVDELARKGSASTDAETTEVPRSMASVNQTILATMWKESSDEWERRTDCRISRTIWPKPNHGHSRMLLRLDRNSMRRTIGLITGHLPIGAHAKRIGLPGGSICRKCEEEDETVEHILCHCPALLSSRRKFLGAYVFRDLTELAGIEPRKIHRFGNAALKERA